MWPSTCFVATLALFLQSALALPGNGTAAPSSTVIEIAGGRTYTVPPGYKPSPAAPLPKYMVDNQHNYFHAAPDKYNPGLVNGRPVPKLRNSPLANRSNNDDILEKRQSSSYWLANVGHGSVRAVSYYQY